VSVRDNIRASRHAQGQAARERVLTGQSSQPQEPQARSRDYIRNRTIQAPVNPLMKVADAIGGVSGAVQGFVNNPMVQSTVSGINQAANQQTQQIINQGMPSGAQMLGDFNKAHPVVSTPTADEWMASEKAKREAKAPKGGIGGFLYDTIAEPWAAGIDAIQAKIPGLADFQQGAGEALGIEAQTAPPTGGMLGKVAGVAGNIAGFVSNPAQIEQNLITAPYKAAQAVTGGERAGNLLGSADNLLARGANAINPVLNRAGLNVGSNITQGLARRAAEGAIAGGIQGAANSGVRGETDLQDVAKSAGIGALLGGGGDAAIGLLGGVAKSFMKSKPVVSSPEQQLALPLGREDAARLARAPKPGTDPIIPQPTLALPEGSGVSAVGRASAPVERVGRAPELSPIRNPEVISPAADITPSGKPLIQTEQSSSTLGISPFGNKSKPYDNVSHDTKSQLVTRQDKEKLPMGAKASKLYTDLVDDLYPIQRFDEEVEKVIGDKLSPSDKAHTLGLGTRGADVISRQILTDKLVDANGHIIGKSMKEILNDLPKKKHSYVDFEDYLLNKHAITRAERGEKVFRKELEWTPEYGAEKIAAYDAAYPQFAQMANDIYDFQTNMVQKWLVDTGMLTQDQADAFLKANPTYVPNKRFFSEMEKGSGGKSRAKDGFAGQSAPVKKYSKTGSERKIISPIEAIIENVDGFVKAAKRNQTMQAVVRNIRKDPEALESFAQFVDETQTMTGQSLKDVNRILNEEGIDGLVSQLTNDFDASYRKAVQSGLDKDNVVRVMVDGEPVYLQINDKPMLDAITAMGPESTNALLQMVGKLTMFFKTTTTGANPVFSLARNLWRDIPQAYTASKTTNNPITFFGDLLEAAYAIVKNKDLYKDFKRVGGGHSSSIAADRNLLNQSKRQVLPQRNLAKGALPRAYDKYLDFLNAVETAPRLAEFKRAAADGTDEGKIKGLFESQDITVNFKRRGKLTKDFDKFFPYANAAVQGLDKTGRMFKDAPAKALTKAAIAVGLPSMVAYMINYGNPDYDKVSRRTKDNFILFPKGDGTFWKIAKPKELGTVFADIPERLLDLFKKQDPDAFDDFADTIRTNFLPPGISGFMKSGGITDRLGGALGDTIFGPIMNVRANKDFADRPIVPGYLENLSPELQSDPRTSSIAKWLGGQMHTSPKEIDYILRQYTGFLGQIGQPLFAPGGSVGQSLLQQVTVDPVFSNDISNKMYDSKGKLDQARTDYNVTGELPDDYNDGLRKYLGKVTDAMGDIRKQMRAIEADKSIPAASKRKQLRDLQEQINQLAGQGNEAVQSTK